MVEKAGLDVDVADTSVVAMARASQVEYCMMGSSSSSSFTAAGTVQLMGGQVSEMRSSSRN